MKLKTLATLLMALLLAITPILPVYADDFIGWSLSEAERLMMESDSVEQEEVNIPMDEVELAPDPITIEDEDVPLGLLDWIRSLISGSSSTPKPTATPKPTRTPAPTSPPAPTVAPTIAPTVAPTDPPVVEESPSVVEPEPEPVITTFATVKEMRGANVESGTVLTTLGYYAEEDGGAAEYEARDSGTESLTVIALDNGLFAHLIIGDTVNVVQFGALSDGVTDSKASIQAAFDSGASIVNFPPHGEFMVHSQLTPQSNTAINGYGSTIITDDNYISTATIFPEYFFIVYKVDNLSVNNLNLTAVHTKDTYGMQVVIAVSSNIEFIGCTLTGPEPSYDASGNSKITSFGNIDLFTGWHDITIRDCTLYLSHDSAAGGCIWVRDIWGSTSSGLTFENNYCYKNCHDEIVGVGMLNAKMSDLNFIGNTFIMEDGTTTSSSIGITLGCAETVSLSGVNFIDNIVDIQASFAVINVNGPVSDFLFEGNTISASRGRGYNNAGASTSTGGYIFYYGASGDDKPVLEVVNNKIYIDNTGAYPTNIVFNGKLNIIENEIYIDGDLYSSLFSYSNSAIGNLVSSNGLITTLAYNTPDFSKNIVDADRLGTLFRYFNITLAETSIVESNTIKSYTPYENASYLVLTTGLDLGGQYIDIQNNYIDVPAKASGGATDFRYAVAMAQSGTSTKTDLSDTSADVNAIDKSNSLYLAANNTISSTLRGLYSSGAVNIIAPSSFTQPGSTSIQDGDVPMDETPTSNNYVIVVVILGVSIIAFGCILIYRRRKNHSA